MYETECQQLLPYKGGSIQPGQVRGGKQLIQHRLMDQHMASIKLNILQVAIRLLAGNQQALQ